MAYVTRPTDDNKIVFYRSRRLVQQRLRALQDAWTARKAEEIQTCDDRKRMEELLPAKKAVNGPLTKATAPLFRTDDRTLLTKGVLKRPATIYDAAIVRLSQVETNTYLDRPPSLYETIWDVQQLSSGKTLGSDAIRVEIYKHGGPQLMEHLTALLQKIWCHGEVPQDFKDATIVHLYKRKGGRQICENHGGIPLLNRAGKIFVRIVPNRLNHHLEPGLLPENQCSFHRHRETTDKIFAVPQLQEKCQEMRCSLCSTFADLKKAFDTVNREGLWKIMQKFGCL
nr:unnamed protein product [Spirometra erinaceieuropaei]